jgi:epoxyqueuosine reductase
LIQEMALTVERFNRKFHGSPVKRTKRRGYLRNVAVALGNYGDPAAAPALVKALLEDPEALVRGHAAWALGQIGGEKARAALLGATRDENDGFVIGEIEAATHALEG